MTMGEPTDQAPPLRPGLDEVDQDILAWMSEHQLQTLSTMEALTDTSTSTNDSAAEHQATNRSSPTLSNHNSASSQSGQQQQQQQPDNFVVYFPQGIAGPMTLIYPWQKDVQANAVPTLPETTTSSSSNARPSSAYTSIPWGNNNNSNSSNHTTSNSNRSATPAGSRLLTERLLASNNHASAKVQSSMQKQALADSRDVIHEYEALRSKNNSAGLPPLKALSAYNYFFRDERDRLLQGDGGSLDVSAAHERHLLMNHWTRDRTKKRPHRKSHGKIDFTSLSKLISSRWKALSEEGKNFYRQVAAKDWERYLRETGPCPK